MSISFRRGTVWVIAFVFAALAMNGCGDKDAKWYGTWVNSADQSTLVIKPEHKASLTAMGNSSDVTWEPTAGADDKITVNIPFPVAMYYQSDGTLRDQQGAIWKKK